jgi:prephenate dehydrogenase
MKIHTLTIVGVGLIGGSIGLAARRRGLAEQVLGVGRQWDSLETARQLGLVDDHSLDLTSAVCGADLVIFCTPVNRIVQQVLDAAPHCRPGTLITDAGSTKALIVRELEGCLPADVHFVGSHPLAGSEKRGHEAAEANLFQDRLTVVTPTVHTDPTALGQTCDFWQALGCRVRTLSPEEHDRALALTSHLPHLVAAAMAGILPAELYELTATGFRDTTRIAAGDPALWTAIFQQNREAVLQALQLLDSRLEEFQRALAADDTMALDSLLTQAKQVRDDLGN